MIAYVRDLLSGWLAWIWPRVVVPPLPPVETRHVPDVPPARVPRVRRPRAQHDFIWNFRHGLLERLDEYFVCVARRLRQHDPGAYELFRRVGFTVSADGFA